MESLILQVLGFRVVRPNAHTLMCLFRQALGLTQREAALATYLTVRHPGNSRPEHGQHSRDSVTNHKQSSQLCLSHGPVSTDQIIQPPAAVSSGVDWKVE